MIPSRVRGHAYQLFQFSLIRFIAEDCEMSSRLYERALSEMKTGTRNIRRVKTWLRAAQSAGDHRATYALGTWYLHGTHLKKDVKEGTRLIRLAAKANVPDALFDLAVSCEKGIGVRRNLKRAAELYLA